MVSKLTIRSTNILRYDWFRYKLLLSKEKHCKFYLLNFSIYFPYFHIELFFKRRPLQSENGHNHQTLLMFNIFIRRIFVKYGIIIFYDVCIYLKLEDKKVALLDFLCSCPIHHCQRINRTCFYVTKMDKSYLLWISTQTV